MAEEANNIPLTESEIARNFLIMLDESISNLFDYLKTGNEEMKQDIYDLIKELKDLYNYRGKLTKNQIDLYYELIEQIRRDISCELGCAYRHKGYNIPEEHFQELFMEYRTKYAMIF